MVVLEDCGTVHMQSLNLEDFDQGMSGQHCNLLPQVKDQNGSVAIICHYPYMFWSYVSLHMWLPGSLLILTPSS